MTTADNRGAVGHPLSWAACALILINDFVLRPRWDNWWTGKLSDLAWLVIVPLVLAAIVAPRSRVWGPRLAALTLTATTYITLQLWAPLGAFVSAAHVADAGDLVVLPALLLAPLVWARQARALAPTVALPVMIVALVADSPATWPPDTTYPCGSGAIWPTDFGLRFRVTGVEAIDTDTFLQGVQIYDENGVDVPIFVVNDGESYVVCPKDGFRPETGYTFEVGPWEQAPGHEIAVGSDAMLRTLFTTDDREGVPVTDADACARLAPTIPTDGTCDWSNDGSDTGYIE